MDKEEKTLSAEPFGMVGPNPPASPCSESVCGAGHRWVPTMGMAKCPGCGAPVLAVRMENCPHCNEPCVETRMRVDHLGWKGSVVGLCRGYPSIADVSEVVMTREHWRVMEEHEVPVGFQPQVRRECATKEATEGG